MNRGSMYGISKGRIEETSSNTPPMSKRFDDIERNRLSTNPFESTLNSGFNDNQLGFENQYGQQANSGQLSSRITRRKTELEQDIQGP